MEDIELTIDPHDVTVITDRRGRRSEVTTQAIAFQCAHIQEGLGLDALVVADDAGDRWVGAGDRALCRFLSKNAPELAAGEHDAAMKLRALQTISDGLGAAHVTTARVLVPHMNGRYLYVTGVGDNRLRRNGVATTANGSKRILGYEQPLPAATKSDLDADATLQQMVDGAYARLVSAAGVSGAAPQGFMGMFDDRVYRDALNHVLAPAFDALAQSGVIVDDVWRNYRLRTREVRIENGLYERTFTGSLRQAHAGVRLGELEVRFFHRHDRWEIPYCPRLTLRWR